jgi:hypothetical protein
LPAQCRPEDYLTTEQHEIICGRNRDAILNWAHQVADDSVKDREHLHNRVDELKDLIPKFQWWFIGLLAAIILSNILGPKLLTNGNKEIKEAQQAIIAIESKQARHEGISAKTQKDLGLIMKKMGIRENE